MHRSSPVRSSSFFWSFIPDFIAVIRWKNVKDCTAQRMMIARGTNEAKNWLWLMKQILQGQGLIHLMAILWWNFSYWLLRLSNSILADQDKTLAKQSIVSVGTRTGLFDGCDFETGNNGRSNQLLGSSWWWLWCLQRSQWRNLCHAP